MAFKHGKNTTVLVGAVNMSPYLDSMDLSADMDTADTTMFQATWKSAITGVASGKVDWSGGYDPTQSTLPTLFFSLLPGVLTYCPGGGATINDGARLVSAMDTSYSESSPVGGLVAAKGSILATGVVGFGSVTHPLGTDTNTTTGASKDELAQTTSGWTAHLHVTAVSAGSWVVTIEDSSTGSSGWALVTGATFTAATGATSQRLTGAAGATVKQYIRYVATRTGGSASDTITFHLSFARN
jgi:hypothetical protein